MRHDFLPIATAFNGSGYGSKHTLSLETGSVIKMLCLRCTNIENNQLSRVLLKMNGTRTIVDLSGEELRMLDALNQHVQEDGVFYIPFVPMGLGKGEQGEDTGELVTFGSDNLTLEVTVAAATGAQTAASASPSIALTAVYGKPKSQRLFYPSMYTDLVQVGKNGYNVYRDFVRGARIRGMHLDSSAVDQLELKRDKQVVFDLSRAENHGLLRRLGFAPQGDYYHFYPVFTGSYMSDPLKTAGSSFEINPTVSAVGDVPVLFDVIEQLDAIETPNG